MTYHSYNLIMSFYDSPMYCTYPCYSKLLCTDIANCIGYALLVISYYETGKYNIQTRLTGIEVSDHSGHQV